MVFSLQDNLLSASMAVFDWAKNVYDCGFMNDLFTVTSNMTIALRQVTASQVFENVLVQNLFLGGRRNLEIYSWLPTELQDGTGGSHQVPIFVGILVLSTLLLLVFPLTVVILNCKCDSCCKSRCRKISNLKHFKISVSLVSILVPFF